MGVSVERFVMTWSYQTFCYCPSVNCYYKYLSKFHTRRRMLRRNPVDAGHHLRPGLHTCYIQNSFVYLLFLFIQCHAVCAGPILSERSDTNRSDDPLTSSWRPATAPDLWLSTSWAWKYPTSSSMLYIVFKRFNTWWRSVLFMQDDCCTTCQYMRHNIRHSRCHDGLLRPLLVWLCKLSLQQVHKL